MYKDNTYRYERKFSTSTMMTANVGAFIRRHPSMFFKAHPDRYVNNIYLDIQILIYIYSKLIKNLLVYLKLIKIYIHSFILK